MNHPTFNLTALVTGASGGIGEELARQLAAQGINLLLVARREERLQTLAHELGEAHGIQAFALALDLADPGAAAEIERECQFRGLSIDFLINNAGFGDFGEFAASDLGKQLDMIQVNITTLTELTWRFLPGMLERRRGRVLNVASTAAFMPGPLMAVYYASKAYVLSFSEALHEEVRGTGVYVTALCPGPTETGFVQRAQMQQSRLIPNAHASGSVLSAEEVARQGLEAMFRGDSVHIAGATNVLTAVAPRLLPRGLMPRLVRQIQERK